MWRTLSWIWKYNRSDAIPLVGTFAAVLILGIEVGILVGVGLSIAMYLWRSSRPHIAVIGRLPDGSGYRNIERHDVETWPGVLLLRLDEGVYFANATFLEDRVMSSMTDHPDVLIIALSGIAINQIDTSALESLVEMVAELREVGVKLHLAEIKGPVMDRLQRTHLLKTIDSDRVHLTLDDAVDCVLAADLNQN